MSVVADEDEDRLFRLHPLACVDIRLDGAIVRANPAFCAVSGHSEDQLRELGLFAIVCQDARDEVQQALSLARSSDVSTFDAPISRIDGDVRWLEWRGVRMLGRNLLQFAVYDVTQARCIADASQERERFLSTLLANLPGAAYRCKNDSDWTMEFVSAGVKNLTGYSVEDFIANKSISFGAIIHPDDAPGVWDVVQAAIAKEKPFAMEYRIRTQSGEERWCHESGSGVYAHGELQAIEGFITDITDRIRTEREVRDKLEVIEAQRNQIADLSLPIIEVWDGVLTLPLMGILDGFRTAKIMEGLLDAVVRTQSEHVIVDLTAVEHIDARVAEHLVAIVHAVELLGARGILSGIRPEAAKTLVASSTNLGGIPTTSDLREALRLCMKREARSSQSRKR